MVYVCCMYLGSFDVKRDIVHVYLSSYLKYFMDDWDRDRLLHKKGS